MSLHCNSTLCPQSSTSRREDPVQSQASPCVLFSQIKQHWYYFLSENFGFPMSVTISQLRHVICGLKDKQAVHYSSQFCRYSSINHEYKLVLPFLYLRFYALFVLGANITKFKVTDNLIFQFLAKIIATWRSCKCLSFENVC